ncbi:MAG TPA: Rne/Rng family ribonuclease [Xanthobacteraceae bacterium]|nr:Rne/Rng family ribonuclease [Xanthobacteraceae bacterium]
MANKMLIDATHPEETRVVVVRGSRVEEFDFEAANRKPLRGNIYLAKVTRVEPSLQAAFIEYGGNRHGFLAFSEIHPDYYQIPVADRQALLAEEERNQRKDAEDEEERPRGRPRRSRNGGSAARSAAGDETVSESAGDGAHENDDTPRDDVLHDDAPHDDASQDDASQDEPAATSAEPGPDGEESERQTRAPRRAESSSDESGGVEEVVGEEEIVEQIGSDDAMEEVPERAPPRRGRSYKIQEVIKRRQIMLVQVVKEERGNKGAALTTYLSLAGRYSVLMPNTARGGGISRKITSAEDRKRLKEVASDLEVPEGMGIILRTAGANRTKAEIKRDFEYLLRLWENVRELTLSSSAPTLVYEEGSLIKRSIRDLYNKDIDEVLVAGEEGHREAKDFMRMLMPSHSKNVKSYKDPQPIFARFGVESQLDAMFSPVVQLKSGGYIVINPTEALVSIDVNSGRSTREHNIEDTALKTNLEASEEVARQLRLRDLAGLIVIDFIDMEEKRNNRAVERKLKDCLKNDRARIQLGRISHFGLMEMSRQRIRTGVLESSTEVCPHCGGTGHVRSTASVALQLLRAVEDMLLRANTYNLIARTRTETALYLLNHKRAHLHELETRFGVAVHVAADPSLVGYQPFAIDKGEAVLNPIPLPKPTEPVIEAEEEDDAELEPIDEAAETTPEEPVAEEAAENAGAPAAEEGGEAGRRRRRRRRRRRGGEAGTSNGADAAGTDEDGEAEDGDEDEPSIAPAPDSAVFEETPVESVTLDSPAPPAVEAEPQEAAGEPASELPAAEPEAEEAPRRRGRRGGRRPRRDTETETATTDAAPTESAEPAPAAASEPEPEPVAPAKPARRRRSTVREAAPAEPAPVVAEEVPPSSEATSSAFDETVTEPAPADIAPAGFDPAEEPSTESSQVDAVPADTSPSEIEPEANAPDPEPDQPRRTGWWQRRLFGV